MTPEEIHSRWRDLVRRLAAARQDLEQLLPHLSGETHLGIARGVLRDVSRAAFNCTSITEQGAEPPPFAVSNGPKLGGSIYALTQIGGPDPNQRGRPRRGTVGFFWTVEQAEEVLAENYGHLNEAGFYPWAVIEEVAPGLHPDKWDQRYWEYDRRTEQWKKVDGCPAVLQGYLREWYGGEIRRGPTWCEIG
jgi:hypothetical protein